MIFLTVGTIFPFDRLVRAMDMAVKTGLIKEKVFAQIGTSGFKPENMEYVESLDKESFNRVIMEASYVVSHAGVGSIVAALEHSKPLLVMPREKRYHEHVNNHQIDIAKKFEQMGHILVAYDENELPEKIQQLSSFTPIPRHPQPQAVTERIRQFLNLLGN